MIEDVIVVIKQVQDNYFTFNYLISCHWYTTLNYSHETIALQGLKKDWDNNMQFTNMIIILYEFKEWHTFSNNKFQTNSKFK